MSFRVHDGGSRWQTSAARIVVGASAQGNPCGLHFGRDVAQRAPRCRPARAREAERCRPCGASLVALPQVANGDIRVHTEHGSASAAARANAFISSTVDGGPLSLSIPQRLGDSTAAARAASDRDQATSA